MPERKFVSREKFVETFFKERDNSCAFCEIPKEEIIHSFDHWNWKPAKSPYWSAFVEEEGKLIRIASHTLLIPKRHIKGIDELKPNEFMELQGIYKACLSVYSQLDLRSMREDGSSDPINQYLGIFRFRENTRQPFEEHLHIHFVPESVDMLKPAFDIEASKVETEKSILDLIDSKGLVI